jgi:hypothetical protein
MDKYQVRSCLSASGSITYDPLTGVIGGSGGGGATWGSITGTLSSQTDLQTALDAKQNESIVINSNTTAVLDGVYTVVASATFTDPTPAEGKGFMVFVRNGTATVGGTGYSTAGTVINRIYHSGAWANYTLSSFTPSALTKTDDTNVTLTLGGTPSTALLQATSLTLGWSGQLAIARGGTGGGLYAGWDLISTATASSSTTIDFTGLSSTYKSYCVVFYDVLPATNSTTFRVRVGTGGTPTYDTGNNYGWSYAFRQGNTTTGGSTGGNGVFTDNAVSLGNNTLSNNANRPVSGRLWLYNPSQSTTYHYLDCTFNYQNDSSALITGVDEMGVYKSTTAITALRFFMASGNIASGIFELYGIR